MVIFIRVVIICSVNCIKMGKLVLYLIKIFLMKECLFYKFKEGC